MQYAVPQFIDAEDKLIGPFTLKQFGIVFAAGIIDVLFFKVFGFGLIFIVLGLPVAVAGLGLAFVPFNGRQLYQMIPMFISFATKPKVYIFKHTAPSIQSMHLKEKKTKAVTVAQASENLESPQSALKRLSLSLDARKDTESDLISKSPLRNTYAK